MPPEGSFKAFDNNMLLEFSAKNFLSFKDEVIFSLYASDEIKGHEDTNLIPVAGRHILKTAVIYGANASGKSNFIKAMGFMRSVISNSLKLNPEEPIVSNPQGFPSFQLNTNTAQAPVELEVCFLYQDIYFRYGFILDALKIHKEWLYIAPEEKETLVYKRHLEEDKYIYNIPDDFSEVREYTKEKALLTNTLLLVVLAKFIDSPARRVMEWIENTLNVISDSDKDIVKIFTDIKLGEEKYREDILNFLKAADVGIENAFLKSAKKSDLSDNIDKDLQILDMLFLKRVISEHNIFNDEGSVTGKKQWELNHESAGTQKLFALSGPLIETLRKGEVLVIDELDAKLHPMMMRFILGLFHSPEHNPQGAQLVFATHDTRLLSPRFFRRDQIWFTEKNRYGASELYSLSEFDLEDDAKFSEDYFQGRYNAVPFIGDLRLFDKEEIHGEG